MTIQNYYTAGAVVRFACTEQEPQIPQTAQDIGDDFFRGLGGVQG